jgi:ribosomal protein S18 acetylase RimI-like enzyme
MNLEHEATIFREWNDEEVNFVKESLINFNFTTAPTTQNPPSEPLNLILKDKGGSVIGGLLGRVYRFCLYIEILWVDEKFRKYGYGSKLLSKSEEIVREKGCKLIHLDTFSFQAPDFYKRHGFEVFGILDGFPEGIARYYLKKSL